MVTFQCNNLWAAVYDEICFTQKVMEINTCEQKERVKEQIMIKINVDK